MKKDIKEMWGLKYRIKGGCVCNSKWYGTRMYDSFDLAVNDYVKLWEKDYIDAIVIYEPGFLYKRNNTKILWLDYKSDIFQLIGLNY